MLYGCILLDGDSYELYDYFDRTGDVLDEVAGSHIELLAVGDPEKSGPIHKSLLSEQQRKRDAEDARTYPKQIYQTGREVSHRRNEVRAVREGLDVPAEDLPCIAFVDAGGSRAIGILRIAPSWYESPSSTRAFGKCLRSWLSREDVKRLATSDLGESSFGVQLGGLLDRLNTEIDAEIRAQPGPGRPTPATQKRVARIETPLGTSWRDVSVTFVNDRTASVTVGGAEHRVDYKKMGMVDRRTGQPNKLWELLCVFAMRGGCLTWHDSEADRTKQKQRERLARELRGIFGIGQDPFCFVKDGKGWQTRFGLQWRD